MKILNLVPALVLFYSSINAQTVDDFSDGDFTQNPVWAGDNAQFIVNAGALQLNSSGSDSSSLTTGFNFTANQNQEWKVSLKMSFAPSSANYNRIYLASDQSNLEGSLNGFFLQFGESGSGDAIELFRQSGWAITSIVRGISGEIATGVNHDIRVLRDSIGNWKLWSRANGTVAYTLEGIGQNIASVNGIYLGIKCVYTSSNSTKTFLDNVYAGPEIIDSIAPKAMSVQAIDSSRIRIQFSEVIDQYSASQVNNYNLVESTPTLQTIMYDSIHMNAVEVLFNTSFQNRHDYHLAIKSIKDLAGNQSPYDTLIIHFLLPEDAVPGDVVISEIMADPASAPSLPDAEYVEIYNRSNKVLSTKNWQLDDGSTFSNLPDDTLLPNEYRLYCNSTNVSSLLSAGAEHVKGLSSFPGLNNDGDNVKLSNGNGLQLDRVSYTAKSYQDDLKSAGGWSLERIDENYSCPATKNWRASIDKRGGSPGIQNSVSGVFTDDQSFILEYATIIDSIHVELVFNKAVDTLVAQIVSVYSIDSYAGQIISANAIEPGFTSVILTLNASLDSSIIYTINIGEAFKSCAGQSLADKFCKMGFYQSADKGDLIINEVLFNPIGDESDFVEIYNRSSHVIDLSKISLANTDLSTGKTNEVKQFCFESRPIFPNQYIAVTENQDALITRYTCNKKALQIGDLPSYNDDEGEVRLLDNSLLLIDSLHYTDQMHDPLLKDVEGVSLERINPTSTLAYWHSAAETAGFATPGYENSEFQSENDTNKLIDVSPELFSPDNDGDRDVQIISIHSNKIGCIADLVIYDRYGNRIRNLANHESAGSNASWQWDGLNENRKVQEPGIYILVAEIINPDGILIREKRALVLARRD